MYKVKEVTIYCAWDNENKDTLTHTYIFTEDITSNAFKLRDFNVTFFEVTKRNTITIYATNFKFN
jgi:hypothetical protein